jgi:hypothetical protein
LKEKKQKPNERTVKFSLSNKILKIRVKLQMFNPKDLTQISDHPLKIEDVNYQIEKFKNGFPPTMLQAPSVDGQGLMILPPTEVDKLADYYQTNLAGKNIVKFVPASGAATRMFKTLYGFISKYTGSNSDYEKMIADQSSGSVFTFFKELQRFAFYEDLKQAFKRNHGQSLEEAQLKRDYVKILKTLLDADGLDYGSLPKGLLKFHVMEGASRTPVEEHMVEGAEYAKDASGNVKLHFTVSPEHQSKFEAHVSSIKGKYEAKYGVKISVSYSIQKPSTDTIAVNLDNSPFREDDGALLFRPAGHGALLENLNDIDADIVFIKNIDNVVPDHLKPETTKYKQVLGGLLISYQKKVGDALANLNQGKCLDEAIALLEDHLGYKFGSSLDGKSTEEKFEIVKLKLNRPLRVCGMVKSEGDPGGGPFWVNAADGSTSLQIVESAQIDFTNEGQNAVFQNATHFNPADLACFLKDVDGKKFDLLSFRDPDTGFITQKSKDGKDLKAQELPGLWNGAMAGWSSVFVEVPIVTFNPVKSVNDLLKAEHQV